MSAMLGHNLIDLIVKNAAEMPDEVAIREKRFGVWSPLTWEELREKVQRFALGLLTLGFGPNQRLAIIGDNKPEWIIAEFGAMAAGGLPTGAYPDSLPEEMEYLISYAEARFLVLRDQEQADKILTEDDLAACKEEIQTLTKRFEGKVNDLADRKTAEILEN